MYFSTSRATDSPSYPYDEDVSTDEEHVTSWAKLTDEELKDTKIRDMLSVITILYEAYNTSARSVPVYCFSKPS